MRLLKSTNRDICRFPQSTPSIGKNVVFHQEFLLSTCMEGLEGELMILIGEFVLKFKNFWVT
jgi:hypothetical protein